MVDKKSYQKKTNDLTPKEQAQEASKTAPQTPPKKFPSAPSLKVSIPTVKKESLEKPSESLEELSRKKQQETADLLKKNIEYAQQKMKREIEKMNPSSTSVGEVNTTSRRGLDVFPEEIHIREKGSTKKNKQ